MQKNVLMVAPFTTRDLAQRSIADVIFDLQERMKNYTAKDPDPDQDFWLPDPAGEKMHFWVPTFFYMKVFLFKVCFFLSSII